MRVLVTGAASGLGAALVAAFRSRGDEVLATDRVRADGIDLVLDITSDADWEEAVSAVRRRWGGLDVLVNNAGIAGGGRIERCSMQEWRDLSEVNLFGVVRGVLLVAVAFIVYDIAVAANTVPMVDNSRSAKVFASFQTNIDEAIPSDAPGWIVARYEALTSICAAPAVPAATTPPASN